jgi:predicted nicotinamide N-methyase
MAGSNVAQARPRRPAGVAGFIRTNLPLAPAPLLPEILLHAAHPASGLWRLSRMNRADPDAPPYWAYPWAGGAALARHFFARPETVSGRRVLDLGAGSGVVGIAAAKSGANAVIASEIDRNAIAALRLNAAANDVLIEIVAQDLLGGDPPPVDLVAVGDFFYERDLAEKAMAFLDRCRAGRIEVLIGDIGRTFLPRTRLRQIAEYPVRDFGDGGNNPSRLGGVFAFAPE